MKRLVLGLALLAVPAVAQTPPDPEKAALGAEVMACVRDKVVIRMDAAKEIEALRAKVAELEARK